MTIVTRFAPSPTGYLHIGGARTALFSWLLARHAKGRFLLRIEDTDRQRSTREATDAIIDSMKWLGLDHDGEIVFQSQRIDRHNEAIDQLLAKGKAYWCECTPDQVEAMRVKARAEGRKPKYDNSCRARNLGPGSGRVVRFKTPLDGATSYLDMVKGPTSIENAEMDDMILRRADGSPTYNLAVVVDDHDMGVTRVLRGDDHVANTPKQILLYQALGWDVPEFGHVPMILGPDKKKLSKRHGALSVMEYEKMGYLPQAMLNYLARLGWSHGDQEVFTPKELVELFDTDNLGSSASVFDMKKLDWLNSQYMQAADPRDLVRPLSDFLSRIDIPDADPDVLKKAIPLLQPRAKTLVELAEMSLIFVTKSADIEYDPKAVEKFLTPESVALLREFAAELEKAPDFRPEPLEEMAKGFIEARDLKFKHIAQPIRVAITGKTASPGLFETMEVLGREETLKRMARAFQL